MQHFRRDNGYRSWRVIESRHRISELRYRVVNCILRIVGRYKTIGRPRWSSLLTFTSRGCVLFTLCLAAVKNKSLPDRLRNRYMIDYTLFMVYRLRFRNAVIG